MWATRANHLARLVPQSIFSACPLPFLVHQHKLTWHSPCMSTTVLELALTPQLVHPAQSNTLLCQQSLITKSNHMKTYINLCVFVCSFLIPICSCRSSQMQPRDACTFAWVHRFVGIVCEIPCVPWKTQDKFNHNMVHYFHAFPVPHPGRPPHQTHPLTPIQTHKSKAPSSHS